MRIFVTGIGTGIGKTVLSAVLCEALQADYWKPVQAGSLDFTDSDRVKSLITNKKSKFHNETFRLNTACSPHLAAAIDKVNCELKDFSIPASDNSLVIEGAGGLLVPLNERELVIDLIGQLDAPVLLVSRNYLGSINHTLLSIEALEARSLPILGVVFNGPENPETEKIITKFKNIKVIGRIFEEPTFGKEEVKRYALQFKKALDELSK